MTEQIQDEIINFEDFEEYNISYPMIITRWEIKQVRGFNKQYLEVYFQRISDTVKAFKFNVKCYSAFGEVIEEITDISIQEVDKKSVQFSEVVPLKTEIRKVEINLKQCLLLDDSIVEPKGKQMAINNFKPFIEEDSEAGKRLLPSAKGFPVDNVSHWYCACGALHTAEMHKCENCNKTKQEVFALVTAEKIQEEKLTIAETERNNSKKRNIQKIVLAGITFATILVTLIPLIIYMAIAPKLLNFGHDSELIAWLIPLLVITLGLFVGYLIGLVLKFKIFKKFELATIIACLIINVICIILAFAFDIGYKWHSNYGSHIKTCLALSILTIPLATAYFVLNINKVYDKVCNLFEFKRNKK